MTQIPTDRLAEVSPTAWMYHLPGDLEHGWQRYEFARRIQSYDGMSCNEEDAGMVETRLFSEAVLQSLSTDLDKAQQRLAAVDAENVRLRAVAECWLQLYADARCPKSDSNTAFVDVRDLEAFAAQTRAALNQPGKEAQWQLIGDYPPHNPVLVSRPTVKVIFTPTAAFYDATGVWRVFRSKGGMEPLPFDPTHWMPLPAVPSQVPA